MLCIRCLVSDIGQADEGVKPDERVKTDDGGVLDPKYLAGRMEKNMEWAWEVNLSAMLQEAKDLVKQYKGTNRIQ